MNSSFVWNNLVTYSLQVGLLVGIAAFVPAMLRFRSPHGKLIYLQLLQHHHDKERYHLQRNYQLCKIVRYKYYCLQGLN